MVVNGNRVDGCGRNRPRLTGGPEDLPGALRESGGQDGTRFGSPTCTKEVKGEVSVESREANSGPDISSTPSRAHKRFGVQV